MQNLIQKNNNFLLKCIILLSLFNINLLAGTVTKNTTKNVYKIFYIVDKMTIKYVENKITRKNKVQVCKKLEESVEDFRIAAQLSADEIRSRARASGREYSGNPSLEDSHYFFSSLKNSRAYYFSHEFNKFLFRVKITNEDLENIHFHDIDISKHTLQNIYSLDNEYDAGEPSFKNINKMVLIQEAIGISAYKLLYDKCEFDLKDDSIIGPFWF